MGTPTHPASQAHTHASEEPVSITSQTTLSREALSADLLRIGIMSANYGSDLHEMQQGFFVRDLPFLPANGRVLPQGHDIFENTTSLENYFNQLSSILIDFH